MPAKKNDMIPTVIKADRRYPIEGREVEYIMSQKEYDFLMDEDRRPKNVHRNKYILDYLNMTAGVLGTITTVRIEA